MLLEPQAPLELEAVRGTTEPKTPLELEAVRGTTDPCYLVSASNIPHYCTKTVLCFLGVLAQWAVAVNRPSLRSSLLLSLSRDLHPWHFPRAVLVAA